MYPQKSETSYTYSADGGRDFLENKPFVETFTLATAILAATQRLQVTSSVLKLPVRPPLYTAKIASSIAALSGNRFILGVGLSVWPEDYAAMGVPWEHRGKRFDECIAIVRGLTKGGYFGFQGQFFEIAPVKLNPVPNVPIPILIGGHSDAALSRAARNDGWMYAGGPPGALQPLLTKLAAFRSDMGTAEAPFRIYATELGDVSRDSILRLEDAGVTDMVVAFRDLYAVEEDSQPLAEKIEAIASFSERVIAKV